MSHTITEKNPQVMMSQYKARLLDASVMVLRLKDSSLAGVFVGDLLELLHIESESERVAWLEDIYQDLSENPSEQYATSEELKMDISISNVDKMLLEEVLNNFGIDLEEALKKMDYSSRKHLSDKADTVVSELISH